ncbi:MAG TPA: hypothetical protein PLD88_14710 [Candidatus Berkiella sp.]|nr:hypothetical protein [Candidatus Berkiella sp.]
MSKPLQVAVNVVAFSLKANQLCVLLVNKRTQDPSWQIPENLIDIEQDLSLEDTAKRALGSPDAAQTLYLEQVQTKGSKERIPNEWSLAVVYYALMSHTVIPQQANLCWMPVEAVLTSKMAFDHQTLIEESLQRLQNKSLYTSLPIFLLPHEFTLTEVQKAYEAVLGFRVEKKSLRRRLLDADFLEETGNIRRASHRPAQLYRLSLPKPYFFARIIEGVREHK